MSEHPTPNTEPRTLTVPDLSLVVLIGASGSGKSTFAREHFQPTEILSSDAFRAWVSDDEGDQSATKDAFDALHHLAAIRLRRGRLVVIDATNVQSESRKPLLALAAEHDVIPVAIVLNVPERICQDRNRERPDRTFGPHVVRNQTRDLRQSLRNIRREGFRYVHVLNGPEEIAAVRIERTRSWTDRRDEHGPFDIIGDIHGCYDELIELLTRLGYTQASPLTPHVYSHPDGRKAVFLGDLVDRGPGVVETARLVMAMVKAGTALCVPGNHDIKLMRWIQGKNVQVTHGLGDSIGQIERLPEEERGSFKRDFAEFVDGLVSHFVLDDGKLVVAHAGMKEPYQGRASRRVRDFAIWGDTTGETDEFGLPVRYPWAEEYRGRAMVVYGHTPVPEPQWLNNTINIDTGCVFGGRITALRYPERELVHVAAKQQYAVPAKPIAVQASGPSGVREAPEGEVYARARIDLLRDHVVQALVHRNTLQALSDREEANVRQLEERARLAEEKGDELLAGMIRREAEQRKTTLEQLRSSLAEADRVSELVKNLVQREGTPPRDPEAAPLPAVRIGDADVLVEELERTAREAAAEAEATDLVLGKEADIDESVRKMREAQTRNRERAVEAITQKNNLHVMIQFEEKLLREMRTVEQEAEVESDTAKLAGIRKELAKRTDGYSKMILGFERAEAAVESIKEAIRAEDDAIRVATSRVLAEKTIARSDAILAEIQRIHGDLQSAIRNPQSAITTQWQSDELLRAEDVIGKRIVETGLAGRVTVRAENAAAALEVMSRFAVEPRWLIYLPPTMSPSETTSEEGYLEYPREAFAYFRNQGVTEVVCQTKHMGSRAVVVVCRDEEAARKRFGAESTLGECYTRTGRRFFDDDSLHRAFLEEVAGAAGRAGLWDELETDWICLDAELMPWNAKAQGLLRDQYAPVGAAAKLSLTLARVAVQSAIERGIALSEVAESLAARAEQVDRYIEAYGRYCWPVAELEDYRLAPFHLLAAEGRAYFDRDHAWHVETLAKLADHTPLLQRTESRRVDLSSPESETEATAWWRGYTESGGEGMVVKPLAFVVKRARGLVQPAVKVRGREYLRIIYGPEYTDPRNLERLRKRGLSTKRSLAAREFALGVEGLERFVRREPLRRVHECAFAVLALESEPVDPRL